MACKVKTYESGMRFKLVLPTNNSNIDEEPRKSSKAPFASASVALSDSMRKGASASAAASHSTSKIDLKPSSDVIAGAMARAASQSTIHPLDTLKVRMQTGCASTLKAAPAAKSVGAAAVVPSQRVAVASGVSKFGRLVPPQPAAAAASVKELLPKVASLYRGVVGAASGAGIAIGAYFAFYGAATNLLVKHTDMKTGQVAFVAGAAAAAGGSVIKVPLAVCIRSVQAGIYPNVMKAASSIMEAAGPRGLFTGYLPTLLEDVPDMAFKFAAYETLRQLHRKLQPDRVASVQEDFAMGAVSGAFAAAATTPLDVIKTNMMCSAASRPTMSSAARAVLRQGGPGQFFRGVGPRALSNGINSAVFFCFFEALRATFAQRKAQKAAVAERAADAKAGRVRMLVTTGGSKASALPESGQAGALVATA